MKRAVSLLLLVFLLSASLSACTGLRGKNDPSSGTDLPSSFEGCPKTSLCGLEREDGICAVVVLNTDDGVLGLLIQTGLPHELAYGNAQKTNPVYANGKAESIYYASTAELRAENCVPAEKPAGIDVGIPVDAWYRPGKIVVLSPYEFIPTAKPVLYLYPEEETIVSVRLRFQGTLTCTYPSYQDGWIVTAAPDGTLTDADGQSYSYLFWEGLGDWKPDFTRGFCVSGADTAAFLEQALARLGLNRLEANEFIAYWLPRMQNNAWNLISFQQQAYTDAAQLEIEPRPDTVIRVFMAWRPIRTPVAVEPQELSAPERCGFTVVEWGGGECPASADP